MSGAAIAAKVAAGLARAGERAGSGGAFTATLYRPGSETGDAHNPTRGSWTSETITVVASDYREREIDGERVQADDRRFLVSTDGISAAPAIGDGLVLGSDGYLVVNVMPVAPGGVPLMWKIQVRGPWSEP